MSCWQFDLSPSDLKQVPAPLWVEAGRGPPTLMLFSVVDDRSGVAYQEYRCVYGEDVAAALRFLFNAMAPKDEAGLVLQGIPAMLYLDNGPVAKSGTFRRVMAQLGVDVRTHMPRGSDGRRVTARSKGKVERPFRTVKEAHETLYHFHTPQNEAEANLWLRNYLVRYNAQPHRSEQRSRAEDWSSRLPEAGIRAMCAWDRFRTFAREPERRTRGHRCPGPGGRHQLRGRSVAGRRDGDVVVGAVRPRAVRRARGPAVRPLWADRRADPAASLSQLPQIHCR